jgi:hypothetical protein
VILSVFARRPRPTAHVSFMVFNRSALLTTETELKLMAAAAIMGLSNSHGEIG